MSRLKLKYDDPVNGVVLVGEFEYDNNIFYKKTNQYMKRKEGYGIQEKVMQRLVELGCEKIELTIPDGTFQNDFSEWMAPNVHVADYGHGKQRFFKKVDLKPKND